MRYKKPLVFFLSAGICLAAAGHRWGDSGHAIGLISDRGGKSRHPSVLKGGKSRYSQVVTAKILPPYRGDARVVLEGEPAMNWEIHSAAPVIDLELRRRPRFRDNTFHGLEPGDNISLWLVMHPKAAGGRSADAGRIAGRGKYTLAFYDTDSGKPLLRIPIIFKSGDSTHGNDRSH